MNTIDHWSTVAMIAAALLVTTPLAFRALDIERKWVQMIAGLLAVAGLAVRPGLLAGALAIPWMMHAALSLWAALRKLRCRPVLDLVGPVLVLGWLTNAAAWLVAHRLGLEPLGFDRVTTLLTVAHFHHAGFGLTALLVGALRHRPGDRRLIGAIAAHQAAMLIVAGGITLGSATDTTWTPTARLEPAGAALIIGVLSIWTYTARRLAHIDPTNTHADRLLAVSAIAWLVPMALALGWALGPILPQPVITTFRVMLGFHAAIHAVGLVICGLAGIAALGPPNTDTSTDEHRNGAHHAVTPATHW